MAQVLVVVLAVGALAYYLKYRPALALSKTLKWLVGAFLLMFLSVWPNLFVQSDLSTWHYNLRSLNMPLVYVLGAIALVFSSGVRVQLQQKTLFYSMGVACVLNGVIALVQRVGFETGRVVGLSTIVGFVTLTSTALFGCYIYVIYSLNNKEKIFLSLAMLLGFVVVLFSATRSAWIAFVVTFLGLSILILYAQKSMRALPYMLGMAAVFVSMFVLDHHLENAHLLHAPRGAQESISHDLKLYMHKDPNSSIGARLVRWQEALAIVRLSPLIGMSLSTKCKRLQEILALAHSYRKAGEIDCRERYDNEIFNALAHRGLLGLGALLLLWVVVGRMFLRALYEHTPICLLVLSMLLFYIALGIGFDPFDFFIEGSFFVGLVVMGVLQIAQKTPPTSG